jgi:excinuclease ABC subunit A
MKYLTKENFIEECFFFRYNKYAKLNQERSQPADQIICDKIENGNAFEQVIMVGQSAIGRTPRSVPATYIGIMDAIRQLFANVTEAKEQQLNESAFSFNASQGQCSNCHGDGKITPKFAADILITCPVCKGKRYKKHILEINIMGKI